jgi:hypothetical protein
MTQASFATAQPRLFVLATYAARCSYEMVPLLLPCGEVWQLQCLE